VAAEQSSLGAAALKIGDPPVYRFGPKPLIATELDVRDCARSRLSPHPLHADAQPLGDLFGGQELCGTGIQAHAADRPVADDVAGLKSSSIGFVLLRASWCVLPLSLRAGAARHERMPGRRALKTRGPERSARHDTGALPAEISP
jgi:hypothetical protein